jgi:hypothetical protein
MKKATVALAVLMLVVLTVAVAQAEICYRLQPFGDVLRLDVEIDDGPPGASHQLIYGNWILAGVYTLPVVGARELNAGSTTIRRLGIHGTNPTAFFGGNRICAVDGIPGGTWTVACTAGAGAPFFVGPGGTVLAAISCDGLSPSSAQVEGAGGIGE